MTTKDKTSAVKKALEKASKDPEFMLAVNRGQKSIKIDMAKTNNPLRYMREQAIQAGFCTHREGTILHLYVD